MTSFEYLCITAQKVVVNVYELLTNTKCCVTTRVLQPRLHVCMCDE